MTERPPRIQGVVYFAMAIVAVVMVVFTLHNIWRPFLPPVEAGNLHLAFGLTLVFLSAALRAEAKLKLVVSLLLLLGGLIATGYIGLNYEALARRIGLATTLDTIIGTALILLVLEATRRAFGLAIPVVTFIVMGYAYFGPILPGFLHHGGFSYARLIGNLSTYLTGIYGSLLYTSTTIIALFMIFGGILSASGATSFFVRFALRLGQRLRSGPALAAVAGSALFGSVNGSPVANASTTGVFTIPLMRRHGYNGNFAAATEAVASTGGTLLPPIMGVAAFLMATITGIPYIQIAGHALIPAILFFAGVALTVHLRSVRLGLKAVPILRSRDPLPVAVAEGATFFGPIAVIVALMLMYYPISYAALMGVTTLLGLIVAREVFLALALPYLLGRPMPQPEAEATDEVSAQFESPLDERRPALWRQLRDGAVEGALGAARIAVTVATLGIIVHAFTMTGLAGRIVHQLSGLSGDSMLMALFVVAGISMLFGLGVPTAGSYVIVAILGAPILVSLDVPVVAAHMFVLYFTMLSGLTPPVGATVIVTAQIAQTSYWKSAIQALGLALPGFVVPFLYVYEPALLGIGDTLTIVWTALSVLLGVYCIAVVNEGQLLSATRPLERLVVAAASVPLLLAGVYGIGMTALGIALLGGAFAAQALRRPSAGPASKLLQR